MTSPITEAARLLAEARENHHLLDDLPVDLVPQTLADAYAIQDIYAVDHEIYGWKVGPARDGGEPRCAILLGHSPLPTRTILSGEAARTTDIELEICIRLAKPLPFRQRAYQLADIEGAISSVHLAIELVRSRFRNREAVSVLSAVADHQGSAGVVLGDPIDDWRQLDLANVELELALDGRSAGSARVGLTLADLLAPVVWLANHAMTRSNGLRCGDIVITGARIGPVPLLNATRVEARGSPFPPVMFFRAA